MTTEHLTELDHEALRGLLGAWALRACPAQEAAALELHLDGCPECAEEAARLRHAAARFSADTPLDQPDGLRQQVIDFCLARRTAELPLAPWAAPYAAETAKLDALLRDLGPSEWQEVAELPWHGGALSLRPAEVLCHLAAVDGLLAVALGLPDSVPAAGPRVPAQGGEPWSALMDRTGRLIRQQSGRPPEEVRTRWRRQSLAIVRTVEPQSEALVDYGFAELPIQDAFLDRAFECWIHSEDVARAVDYPYTAPAPQHLRQMIDLAVRAVPAVLAGRHATAYAGSGVGSRPGRLLKLVIEGLAAGEWVVPLDGAAEGETVAELVIDGVEFCQLAAAHRDPARLPVGEYGDRAAIRELLTALPLLSRP